jgi:hypothetical protein
MAAEQSPGSPLASASVLSCLQDHGTLSTQTDTRECDCIIRSQWKREAPPSVKDVVPSNQAMIVHLVPSLLSCCVFLLFSVPVPCVIALALVLTSGTDGWV